MNITERRIVFSVGSKIVKSIHTLPNIDKNVNLIMFPRYMFAAVAAHKFVIAFCIGLELIASNTRRYLSVIYVCTFAVVSPLGIAIGMCLVGGESAAANGIFHVLLQVQITLFFFSCD